MASVADVTVSVGAGIHSGSSSDAAPIAALERRVAALEAVIHKVRSNCDDNPSPNQRRVTAAIKALGLRGAIIHKVKPGYYDRTLQERSVELCASPHHLCKTLLIENKLCSHTRCDNVLDSRYYCVVLQYTSRLDQDALASSLVAAGAGGGRGKSAFNFQLADAAASKAISGYEYNGLTPFGMTQSVPVLVSSALLSLKPRYAWLGAGDVDLKLRLPVAELLRSDGVGGLEVTCSTPRVAMGDGTWL